jgi:hypothetical protein
MNGGRYEHMDLGRHVGDRVEPAMHDEETELKEPEPTALGAVSAP